MDTTTPRIPSDDGVEASELSFDNSPVDRRSPYPHTVDVHEEDTVDWCFSVSTPKVTVTRREGEPPPGTTQGPEAT